MLILEPETLPNRFIKKEEHANVFMNRRDSLKDFGQSFIRGNNFSCRSLGIILIVSQTLDDTFEGNWALNSPRFSFAPAEKT